MIDAMTTRTMVDRRAVASWAFYDFANSSFTTLVVTFLYATYFTRGIVGDEVTGTVLWSRGVTLSAITVALTAPFLGALTDRGGFRKLLLLGTTVLCVFATAMLFFPVSGQIGRALFWFVVANVSYETGLVFYNVFLPEIASADRIGRVSGYGWATGYLGGLLSLVRLKPTTSKGRYVKGISVSSTMGPGVKVDEVAVANALR